MKHLNLFLIAFCLQALVAGCTKDKSTTGDANPSPSLDQLSDEAVAILDTSRRANFAAEALILPDGRNLLAFLKMVEPSAVHRVSNTATYNYRKANIIALMAYQAWWLTQDRTYSAGGTNEPLQTSGLGYVLGGKDITVRQKSAGTCPEKLYGIDCSGLISNIAKYAHIANPPDGTVNQQLPGKWENALRESFPELSSVVVRDIGYVPTNKLQTGDLVFFSPKGKNINHVGMILKTKSGELALYNSYGNGSDKCEQNYNYLRPGVKKGPTAISIYGNKNIENFLGSNVQRTATLRILDEPGVDYLSGVFPNVKVGTTASTPLRVRVIGADHNGQAGVLIKFDTYDDTRKINLGGTLNPSSVLTDADGYAQSYYTAQSTPLQCTSCYSGTFVYIRRMDGTTEVLEATIPFFIYN